MKKFSEIPWDISNNKWIKHKFEHQSGVARMARQEIAIQLQNMVDCLEFLMGDPDFWHKQIYERSRIYNENERQVYNEMHTSEWW